MQIFQRLFRVSHEQASENTASPCTNKKSRNGKDVESRDIVLYKHNRRSKRVKASDPHLCFTYCKPSAFLCRKDVAKACFYSTIKLRQLGSHDRRQHWNIHSMKMKKEDIARVGTSHKADSATNIAAGNKVLPISDATLSSSTSTNQQRWTLDKKDNNKLERTKTMSRMKELLRWAAAAKSEKGGKFLGRKVLHFRNRAALKAVPDDDQLSIDSPKISFRWDVESCSTTSSAYSGLSLPSSSKNGISLNSTPIHDINHCSAARKGNWITTDTEFVVLEL